MAMRELIAANMRNKIQNFSRADIAILRCYACMMLGCFFKIGLARVIDRFVSTRFFRRVPESALVAVNASMISTRRFSVLYSWHE
jgi:hypothetical protein